MTDDDKIAIVMDNKNTEKSRKSTQKTEKIFKKYKIFDNIVYILWMNVGETIVLPWNKRRKL